MSFLTEVGASFSSALACSGASTAGVAGAAAGAAGAAGAGGLVSSLS